MLALSVTFRFVGLKPFRLTDHCRAIGCRIGGGGALDLGEMDVARAYPYRSDQGTPSVHGLVRTPTASGGRPIPGSDTRPATYPADDVHPAQLT